MLFQTIDRAFILPQAADQSYQALHDSGLIKLQAGRMLTKIPLFPFLFKDA
jgi:hypothetical protein